MVHLLLVVIYFAFISLGLPDSVFGSAWPSMYGQLQVPVFYAGIISMIIAAGTIVSSLASDRLTRKFGPGKITAVSVGITAAALFGFSISGSFWMLCLWAIPYGLGAGSVDAALNNFVALHYASRHMSWLHCMWGVGTIIGPNIMGYALTGGQSWNMGYRYISFLQIALTALLVLSLPLWRKKASLTSGSDPETSPETPLSLVQTLRIPGAKEVMLTFFCYCALEATSMLWVGSYMVLNGGVPAQLAPRYASILFIGITAGRLLNGFLSCKFTDTQLIRMGQWLLLIGGLLLLLPLERFVCMAGIVLIGLGCAPVYPCLIHATPAHFGADKSQAMIGIQMASAYVGTCLMPPIFGLIANHISVSLLPVYLLALLALMVFAHERLVKVAKCGKRGQ